VLPEQIAEDLRRWRKVQSKIGEYVFPGAQGSDHLSRESVEKMMRVTLGLSGKHSAHGWRASFATLCKETDTADPDARARVVDLALDHVHDFVSNQVSANGYIGVFTDAAMILATIVGIVFAVMAFNSMDQALILNGPAQNFAAYVKSWVSWLYEYIVKFFGSVSQQIKDRANKQALAIPKPA
jgi:membrane-associated protease RseP (regulator of RpoE activity)